MNKSSSVAGRALLAVVLMIGFYLLALAIAAGLLYIPYAEVVYAHRIHPKLALICLFGAGAIAWSVVPRIDKFVAPGPRLTADQHPNLFRELEGVASSVQQEMPAEVYLVPDVNAWVMQRGGISNPEDAGKLQPIDWNDVSARVYQPQWVALAKANAAALQGVTPESLPSLAKDFAALGKRFVTTKGQSPGEEHAAGFAPIVIGSAFLALLLHRGAKVGSLPGQPVTASLGSASLEPFTVLESITKGKLNAEAWQSQCAALRLQGMDLGKALEAI